jgi:sulfur-oxidizing protein SoxX
MLASAFALDSASAAGAKVTEGDITYAIVDDRAIPIALTGIPGDPANGAKVVADRRLGNCLACHTVSKLDKEPFQGNVGPALDGAGDRYTPAELRLQIVNSKILNPDSVMPAFFRTAGLVGVRKDFAGKTILTAQQVEDVVAFLSTLKE